MHKQLVKTEEVCRVVFQGEMLLGQKNVPAVQQQLLLMYLQMQKKMLEIITSHCK